MTVTLHAVLPPPAQGLDFTLGCDSEDDETVNPRLLDEGEEGGTLRVGGAVSVSQGWGSRGMSQGQGCVR